MILGGSFSTITDLLLFYNIVLDFGDFVLRVTVTEERQAEESRQYRGVQYIRSLE